MTTLNKEDILRTEEIFMYMTNLPISCFVYALNKFDDWDTESMVILEGQIKSFINKATPLQLQRTRFQNTAAAYPNLGVTNSIKILQDGQIFLQPPILNEGAVQGEFIHSVPMGNVNSCVTIPKQYQYTTYKNFEIVGKNCSPDCQLYTLCKNNLTEKKIYIDDFSCTRLRHF